MMALRFMALGFPAEWIGKNCNGCWEGCPRVRLSGGDKIARPDDYWEGLLY